nr:maltose excess protein 1-like, chloroplastic [Tanacetum cinerariifolium]
MTVAPVKFNLFVNNEHNEISNKSIEQWDSLTAKFAGVANVPFLLLQLPQIVLNARNLMAGNNAALFAVPWLGMFTGLLGNLSLLSYFAKKGETEAMVVQTLGVISTYVVITQLAMAGSMPVPQFTATSVVVACGLLINFLNFFKLLNQSIWNFWEDFITIAGLSALPQVMWSTFVPYVPNSILPGIISFVIAVVTVIMARIGKLPENATKFIDDMWNGRKVSHYALKWVLWYPLIINFVADGSRVHAGHLSSMDGETLYACTFVQVSARSSFWLRLSAYFFGQAMRYGVTVRRMAMVHH